MAENIQNQDAFVYEPIDFIELIKLTFLFIIKKLNLQHILYFAAFLTFGIGDGITGAYMMDKLGVGIEANPVARYLFITQGFWGMVGAKVWITLVILFAVHMVQLRSTENMYWSINGFLMAFTAGGLMLMSANLSALAGEIPQAPGEIIFTYLAMVLMLTEIGSFIDRRAVNHDSSNS